MCLISCSVTTKDKLQSQCSLFHAIADKAKYLLHSLPLDVDRWNSLSCVEPAADRIEEEEKKLLELVFHSFCKNQRGVWSRAAAVTFAVTKTEREAPTV